MGMTTGAVRRKKVTPIRDFAPRNTQLPLQTGVFNRQRMQHGWKRSTMFALAFRFIKLCGYLFVTLLLLLLALNFKLVYQGDGQFNVEAKDQWAFSGTFVSAENSGEGLASTSSSISAKGSARPQSSSSEQASSSSRPRGISQLEKGMAECAHCRSILTEAIKDYEESEGRAVRELDIFSLLSGGYLEEIPNCPAGGEYKLITEEDGRRRVVCSRHIR